MSLEPRENRYLSAVYWIFPRLWQISKIFPLKSVWEILRNNKKEKLPSWKSFDGFPLSIPPTVNRNLPDRSQRMLFNSTHEIDDEGAVKNLFRRAKGENCFPINLIASTPILLFQPDAMCRGLRDLRKTKNIQMFTLMAYQNASLEFVLKLCRWYRW